jgi:hypothetical protein
MTRHGLASITPQAPDLVKGEGFAVDASVLEANASRYHGKARRRPFAVFIGFPHGNGAGLL